MPVLPKSISAAIAALSWLVGAPAAAGDEPPPLGLMGTISIYWGEAAGIDELVAGTAEPHWARAGLAEDFQLRPLSYLDPDALAPLDILLLAQPRALSGEENVELDAWVRGGGRLLLFADPMMTGHSRFAIGDRRRPHDVTLLSPILAHWGLAMEFVEDQPFGTRLIDADGIVLPVNLPGRFVPTGERRTCTLSGEAVLARCSIGRGHVTVLADAALLDLHEPDGSAPAALEALVRFAFGQIGEGTGS